MIPLLSGGLLLLTGAAAWQDGLHGPVPERPSPTVIGFEDAQSSQASLLRVPLPSVPGLDPSLATTTARTDAASTSTIDNADPQKPAASGDLKPLPAASQPARDAAASDRLPSPVPDQPSLLPDPSSSDQIEQDIVVTAKRRDTASDPLRSVNEISYKITDGVDRAIVGPAAKVYEHVTPKPLRKGFRSFLRNLREPVVFVNYVLQLKPGKAAETVGRFAINSTLGLAGVIDVAKRCPFDLPWRPNGFGDTLGVYGIKEGPYLFVPLIGPTTIRDLVGGVVDGVASPIALGGPFKSRAYVLGTNAFRILDTRAEKDDEIKAERDSEEPYAARRDRYLRDRQSRIDRIRGTEATPEDSSDETQEGTVPAEDAGHEPATEAEKRKHRC